MLFQTPLYKATLIKRYKRFLADVQLADGTLTTIHCANTGAMTGCAEPGDTVWYSQSTNPKRKYPYSWELTETAAGHIICVNTHRANQLIAEALDQQLIRPLAHYSTIRSEVPYGEEKSRIDFLLSTPDHADMYVEVKSCTLLEDQQGYFPDTASVRAQKHLRELMQIVGLGSKATVIYAVLHSGIHSVQAAKHLDPIYSDLLAQAQLAGVQIITCFFRLSAQGIEFSHVLEE